MSATLSWGLAALLLAAGMAYSTLRRKLTLPAAGVGGLLGLAIFAGAGWAGLGILTLFFGLGTGASAWRGAEKRRLDLAEANRGQRTTGQVLANAGVAAVLGLVAWRHPAAAPLACLMLAGSFAAATADTLSSELGNVYGRRYYNVLTGRPDTRGENGVISLEGTLFGLAGNAAVASFYCVCYGWGPAFGWLLVAGTVGNLLDSLLGAILERRGLVGNNVVNLLNTLAGAVVVGGLAAL